MAVYNPPQQILFDPLGYANKGKAIRQQLEAGEVDIALKKEELASAPAKRTAAARKEQRDIDAAERAREKADREIKRAIAEGREAEVGYVAEASAASVMAFKEGGSLEQATKVFMDILKGYGASDEDLAEMVKKYDPDGDSIFNEDMMVELEALAFSKHKWNQENDKDYTLSPGSQRRGKNNEILAENPKQATPPSPDYDPPNTQEIETAEQLLKKSDKLSDLSGKDKDIAIQILASDIRQLQERLEIPYDQAAVMAIAALEKKVKDEPGAFYGTNTVLDLSGLADGEYKGIDGKIYVEDADGNLQLRD